MSEHKVTLTWQRGDKPFEYQKYSRDHTWKFDGRARNASVSRTRLSRQSEPGRSGGSVRGFAVELPHADVSRHRVQKEIRARRIR